MGLTAPVGYRSGKRNPLTRGRIAFLKAATHRAVGRVGWRIERFPNPDSHFGHLMQLFDRYSIDSVLDIGANRGQFGLMLRKNGYRGRIVSFEPVPEAHAELQEVAASNPPWDTERLALGSEPGEQALNVTASTSVSSFLVPTQDYQRRYAGGVVSRLEVVEVARLDSIFNTIVSPSSQVFLKVDTQGYDMKVLDGSAGALHRLVGIQMELSVQPIYEGMTDYVEALSRLRQLGFSLTGSFPVERDAGLRIEEFDGVFVRSSASEAAQN